MGQPMEVRVFLAAPFFSLTRPNLSAIRNMVHAFSPSDTFLTGQCAVVIVAAGQGSRFGDDLPKQYHLIHGKPVLRHTIEGFLRHPAVTAIQVVIAAGFEDLYAECVEGLSDLSRLLPPVIGGMTRQESVHHALMALSLNDDDLVLIHDAARPCFSQDSLTCILETLKTHTAASLALPVSDTLRKGNADQFLSLVDRTHLYAMQTPQGFRYGIIKQAHERFKGEDFTDDTALASALGVPVAITQGTRQNIKITHREDLAMAEAFLPSPALVPRTGLGFDVHAFGEAGETIRIGGIDIPHPVRLKGHSDADVVLHAITDALFGVIADGDIGSHFPPNNPDYKGKDSAFFLEEAARAVRAKGGRIVHVDTVIMCEAPKIGPHRAPMQQRIANILGIPAARVSIKATTTEELGFTGRREGIAAQAIVTVLLPDEV